LSAEEVSALGAALGAKVIVESKTTTIQVPPAGVPKACQEVSRLPGMYHLSTITGFDLGQGIAILYHFWKGRRFVVVRTEIPKSDLCLQSIAPTLPAATLYEAEIQDLLGVTFEGSPYAGKRLLLPDDYPATLPPPLRKEADPEKIRKEMKLE
jgi:NADH:ubiquinone oxidoreductase subunit C